MSFKTLNRSGEVCRFLKSEFSVAARLTQTFIGQAI